MMSQHTYLRKSILNRWLLLLLLLLLISVFRSRLVKPLRSSVGIVALVESSLSACICE